VFETMTFEDWRVCTEPKIKGSWNLHTLLPQGLDFFVLLSSVCGVMGQPGQANYSAANTYLDELARYRINKGEKAATLNLGPMLSEGLLAENEALMERFNRTGTLAAVSQNELFSLLDHYCDPGLPLPTQTECQTVTGLKIPANLHTNGIDEPSWMHQPLFNHLYQIDGATTSSSSASSLKQQTVDFAAAFANASSLTEAGTLVTEELAKRLSKILSIPVEDFDLERPIHTYGLDSLVAVEIRNWFQKELKTDVAIFEILGGATFSGVGLSAAGKSEYKKQSWMSVKD